MKILSISEKQIFTLIFSGLLILAIIFRYWNNSYENIIASDGKGYYAYLPAVFIYQDLNFEYFFNGKLLLNNDYTSSFLYFIDGHDVIKYPSGVAVMILPFFILAALLSYVFGLPIDGYSFWFQICTSLSAITYTTFGLFWLYKFLQANKIETQTNIITLLGIVFGTNLLIYTVWDPSMTHAYSFSMISLFCYKVHKTTRKFKGQDLLYASLALGLIALIRPVNVLILLIIPALLPDYKILRSQLLTLIKSPKYIIGGIIICCTIISIQPILWFLQNGHWYVWTYLGESFNFSKPEIIKILFSFRKGWFIYTPLMLLIIPGILLMFTDRLYNISISIFVFISFATFVLSSWWCWYYGGSFGQRSFIDFYAILALPLAYCIQFSKQYRFKIVVFFFVGICIFINLIQSYQYKNNIIHYDSMTRAGYWKVFLKTSDKYKWSLFGNENNMVDADISEYIISKYFQDFEYERPFSWYRKADDISDDALSGNKVISFHKQTEPIKFEIIADTAIQNYSGPKNLRFSGWFLGVADSLSCQVLFINNKDTISITNIKNNEFKKDKSKNRWERRTFDLPIKNDFTESSKLLITFNEFPKEELYLDDAIICIYGNTK